MVYFVFFVHNFDVCIFSSLVLPTTDKESEERYHRNSKPIVSIACTKFSFSVVIDKKNKKYLTASMRILITDAYLKILQ